MATQTTPSTPSETPDAESATQPRGWHPLVPALTSALVLWASFPPAEWSWLAWGALAPLFSLIRSERSRWAIYLSSWLGGLVFWTMAISWVRLTDETAWLGWLTMAMALSLWWPAFVALGRMAVGRLKLPLMLAAPILWVALEFVRGLGPIGGFPWYYLAHSQYRLLPAIQIADLTGALGVSFVMALVSAWLLDLLTRPLLRPTPHGPRIRLSQTVRLATVALALAFTFGYGAFRLATAEFRQGPRLALLQSSFVQRYREARSPRELLAKYEELVQSALRSDPRPDLIVWPETSYPYGYVAIDADLSEEAFQTQLQALDPQATPGDWRQRQQTIAEHLHGWVNQIDVPMVVGLLTYDFHPRGFSRFNSAILFEPSQGEVQSYHKLHLVPFGEYVPLIETFPWLTRLTPYRGEHIPSLAFGPEPRWIDFQGLRIATAICFEDTVPHVVRRLFAEAPDGRPPDLILNISNDGWFHGSSEHDMHLAISVFRAVEHRAALARAVNTGITALIDGNGQIYAALPKMTEGVLTGTVLLDDRRSLYSAWGDWLGWTCLAIMIGLGPLALRGQGRSRLRARQS